MGLIFIMNLHFFSKSHCQWPSQKEGKEMVGQLGPRMTEPKGMDDPALAGWEAFFSSNQRAFRLHLFARRASRGQRTKATEQLQKLSKKERVWEESQVLTRGINGGSSSLLCWRQNFTTTSSSEVRSSSCGFWKRKKRSGWEVAISRRAQYRKIYINHSAQSIFMAFNEKCKRQMKYRWSNLPVRKDTNALSLNRCSLKKQMLTMLYFHYSSMIMHVQDNFESLTATRMQFRSQSSRSPLWPSKFLSALSDGAWNGKKSLLQLKHVYKKRRYYRKKLFNWKKEIIFDDFLKRKFSWFML